MWTDAANSSSEVLLLAVAPLGLAGPLPPGFGDALRLSLIVASCATAGCVVVGVPLAWALSSRRPSPLATVVEWLVLLPLVLPPTVVGWLLIELLGRRGLGSFLERLGVPLLFTLRGAVVASAVVALPLLVLPLRAALQSLDPLMRDAGRIDGAGAVTRAWRIELPLVRGALLAAVTLCFARAIGEFGATIMVAGCMPGRTETLPLAVWSAMASGRSEQALGPALALVGLAALVAAIQRGLLRGVTAARR